MPTAVISLQPRVSSIVISSEVKHFPRVGMDQKLEEVTKVPMIHGANWRGTTLPTLPQTFSQEANQNLSSEIHSRVIKPVNSDQRQEAHKSPAASKSCRDFQGCTSVSPQSCEATAMTLV